MKTCHKCNTTKPVTDFHTDISHADRLSSQCKSCRNEYHKANKERYSALRKEWRKNNLQRDIATARKYYHTHTDKILEQRKLSRQDNDFSIRKKEQKWKIKSRYGVTLEEKEAILSKQQGLCAICHKMVSGFSAVIDHDHETGRIRGILCRSCNFGLALFGDSREGILVALEYLNAPQPPDMNLL